MKRTQRIINTQGQVYATLPVVAGPHEWEVAGLTFKTVLVKCPDNTSKSELSVIHTASGVRLGKIICPAPKSKPHNALQATSQYITALKAQFGEATVRGRIQKAADLT